MTSPSRRLGRLKAVSGRKGPQKVRSLEGYRLSLRLAKAARENGAEDPREFLAWLARKRRGYDARVDGPSELMNLVDDIAEFEQRERDLAERQARGRA